MNDPFPTNEVLWAHEGELVGGWSSGSLEGLTLAGQERAQLARSRWSAT